MTLKRDDCKYCEPKQAGWGPQFNFYVDAEHRDVDGGGWLAPETGGWYASEIILDKLLKSGAGKDAVVVITKGRKGQKVNWKVEVAEHPAEMGISVVDWDGNPMKKVGDTWEIDQENRDRSSDTKKEAPKETPAQTGDEATQRSSETARSASEAQVGVSDLGHLYGQCLVAAKKAWGQRDPSDDALSASTATLFIQACKLGLHLESVAQRSWAERILARVNAIAPATSEKLAEIGTWVDNECKAGRIDEAQWGQIMDRITEIDQAA